MHSVVRGTGTPKDRDEVNRRRGPLVPRQDGEKNLVWFIMNR